MKRLLLVLLAALGWALAAQGEPMETTALRAAFQTDLDRYLAGTGVEQPRNEHGRPFLLLPEHPNGAGVVLVHGFTATPWEMRPVGERLVREGFTVYGVRVPGHGTTPEDLGNRTWQEWVGAVDAAASVLHAACDRVFGVGLSTGALAVLDEAATKPAQFQALVALSPALIHRSNIAWLANYVGWFMGDDVRPLAEEEQPFYYERRPLKAIAQLNNLQKEVGSVLGKIGQPILIMQSQDDATTDPESSEEVLRAVASKQKEIVRFPAGSKVPHVLTTAENPRLGETLDHIAGFLLGQM